MLSIEQYKEILAILCEIEDQDEMSSFLSLIFTDKEIKEFSNRIKILEMLVKKIPQREIAKKLKVGISTVTRGSQALSNDQKNLLTKHLN